MELKIALLLSSLSIVLFFASWPIPKRHGHRQDCWGPTRGFAKMKRTLKDKWGISVAYFATECFSGVLHAPYAFLAHYFIPGMSVESGRWAEALVFIFWMGIGVGRADSAEKQKRVAAAAQLEEA
jgi:hypothetical protein